MCAWFNKAFDFSPRERRSFWVLTTLMACSLAFTVWVHQWHPDRSDVPLMIIEPNQNRSDSAGTRVDPVPVDPNIAGFSDLVDIGLSEKVAGNIIRYREKGGRFRKLNDLGKIYGMTPEMLQEAEPWLVFSGESAGLPESRKAKINALPVEVSDQHPVSYFSFDPNTLNMDGWIRLGVPERAARNAGKYVSKGGRFKEPEDIAKIYGMPPETARALIPWVVIAETSTQHTPKRQNELIGYPLLGTTELNLATVEQLRSCGISGSLCWDVINYRERLGGFYSSSQLSEIRSLDSLSLVQLAACVYIDEKHIRKLSLNAASYTDLANHPYLSDRLARALIQYRDSTGRFRSVDEMARAYRLSPAYLTKLKYYLQL